MKIDLTRVSFEIVSVATMISRFSILAVATLYLFVPTVNGEDCVPASVLTLRIAANAVLSWEVTPNEPCEITEFEVDIVGDRDDEYHFKVTDTYVDLSFLDICEEWHFVVTPISNGVKGYERRLVEHVPLPPDADISLRYLSVTQTGPRAVLFHWDLTNLTLGDCTLTFRIGVEDQENGILQDFYFSGRYAILDTLSPCVPYHFTIRAVNRAFPTIEGPMRYRDYEIPAHAEAAPRLNNIDIGATSVNMSWLLEDAGRNRCPVRALYLDGGNNFNISVPLVNSDERPPVEVDLKGLKPDSMYYFKVSVENSGGISPPAQIAVQTLELGPGVQ